MRPMSFRRSSAIRRPILRRGRSASAERGQALVEFAFIIPVFLALVTGIIEFSLAFNATLGVNRASQEAAHMAAIAGNLTGADCLVLREIETNVSTPAQPSRIRRVEIQRTALTGNVVHARSIWTRTGSTTCTMTDGSTISVPYTVSSNGYPVSARCNVLSGCPTLGADRTTVDNIGVLIEYRYDWVTPLGAILPMIGESGPVAGGEAGRGWTFQKRNVFRMEPQL